MTAPLFMVSVAQRMFRCLGVAGKSDGHDCRTLTPYGRDADGEPRSVRSRDFRSQGERLGAGGDPRRFVQFGGFFAPGGGWLDGCLDLLHGLGAVNNQPTTGAPAPAGPLAWTTTTPAVVIGGEAATVLFSGSRQDLWGCTR